MLLIRANDVASLKKIRRAQSRSLESRLKLNNTHYDRSQGNACKRDLSRSSEFTPQLNDISRSALVETVPSQFSDVRSSARISTRRIAGTNESGAAGDQSLNFVRIDSSVVVTTRRQRSPRGVTLILSVKSKRVARFNLKNVLPTDVNAAEGIIDNNALIANLNTWSMNHKVDQDRNECCDRDASCCIDGIAAHDRLNYSESQQSVTAVSSKDRGFGSEEFNVRHSDASLICEGLHV